MGNDEIELRSFEGELKYWKISKGASKLLNRNSDLKRLQRNKLIKITEEKNIERISLTKKGQRCAKSKRCVVSFFKK